MSSQIDHFFSLLSVVRVLKDTIIPHAGVLNYLKGETSALVNWALTAPEWSLRSQIRVGERACPAN